MMVWRVWKRTGCKLGIDIDRAVDRLHSHPVDDAAAAMSYDQIEQKLRLGNVLETPCALFGIGLAELDEKRQEWIDMQEG